MGQYIEQTKNTKYPFNLGERKSFLECYSVFKTEQEAENELEFAINWNRNVIRKLLHIPSVEVVRPRSTNKKISKRTICIDSITPLNETVITGMTYFHDDIFSKSVNLRYKDQIENRNKIAYSVHFGLSENILFSYLLNSCDGKNLRLYSFIAPIQVNILNALNDDVYDSAIEIYSICNGIQKLVVTTNDINNCLEKVLNTIITLLDKNDKKIIKDMTLREKESIVECDDLEKLDEVVKNGKIAKVHLKNTDESVHIVESHLTGGEVLGFGLNKENGYDIVTQETVDTIAFISRRS